MADIDDMKDVIEAQISATTIALQVLILLLERNGILEVGQYQEALKDVMEASKDRQSDLALALLHDLRQALMQ